MKKMKNLLKGRWTTIIIIVLTTSFTVFTSCNKSEETFNNLNDQNLDLALDQSFASELFDEVIEIADEVMNYNPNDLKSTEMNGNRFMKMGECVIITKVTTQESEVTTVDFGEEGCTGQDGRTRQGIMIMTKTGNYWEGEVQMTYEFQNYYVNGNQMTGTKTTNGFINDAGNRQMDMVDNGSIILADGAGTITRTAQRTREVIEGSDTRNKQDDIIKVTGSNAGICATGETFTSQITTPLIRNNTQDCSRFYVSGVVEIIKGDGTEITINYGDGTCDNLAEITTNGETEIVELESHRRRNQI
jgi:hypothetical protein